MMSSQQLRDAVHDLTRRHIRRDGPTRGQWEDALLDQLQAAVTGIGTGGGKLTSEAAAPANLVAIDTQRAIAEDIQNAAYARREEWQQPIARTLQQWASTDTDTDQQLLRLVLGITDRIRQAIEPQVKPIPLDQACPEPACGRRRLRQQDETGAWTHRPVLQVTCRDETGAGLAVRDWTAHCAACGQEWQGVHAIAWLGRLLMADTHGADQVAPDPEAM